MQNGKKVLCGYNVTKFENVQHLHDTMYMVI